MRADNIRTGESAGVRARNELNYMCTRIWWK
jgi:hypothetical protein